MIKEVEFQNIAETVKVGDEYVGYTTDPALDMFSGYLTDGGNTLTVDVNREVPTGYARQLHLYFANVDFSYSRIEYVNLGRSDLLTNDPAISYVGSSHKFDLTPVYSFPQRSAIGVPINNITIELFTYEANVTEPDGTPIYQKRLSVPYKAVGDASTNYAQSTDGWYVLGTVDYKIQDIREQSLIQYLKGDIIYWYDSLEVNPLTDGPPIVYGDLWIATRDVYGPPGELGDSWAIPTEEDLLNFILIPRPPTITRCATIVHTDLLISRYAKQHFIAEALRRTSFKPYDDDTAWYMADLLSSMREMALNYLQKGDATKAKFMIDSIANEYAAVMLGKKNYELTTTKLRYTP